MWGGMSDKIHAEMQIICCHNPRLPLDKTGNGKYIELVTFRKENNDVDETKKISSLLKGLKKIG